MNLRHASATTRHRYIVAAAIVVAVVLAAAHTPVKASSRAAISRLWKNTARNHGDTFWIVRTGNRIEYDLRASWSGSSRSVKNTTAISISIWRRV